MKKKIIILFMALGAAMAGNAQSITSTDVTTNARDAAMAGAAIALDANAFAVFNNTAAIALRADQIQAGYSFSLWAPQAKTFGSLHNLGGYYKISDRHALALGVRYVAFKEQINTTDNTTFSPFDMMVDLGYAYTINSTMGVAINARYLNSKISEEAGAKAAGVFAGDLSFIYRQDAISAAVGVYNLGGKVNYGGADYDLSSKVKAGAAYAWDIDAMNQLTGSLQGQYFFTAQDDAQVFDAGIGAQYTYDSRYSARAGYHLGDRNTSYTTLGVGIAYGPIVFDAAYLLPITSSSLNNSLWLSIGVRF